MRIALVLGTIRQGRHSEKVFIVLRRMLEARGVDVEVLDLRELALPMFDDTNFDHPGVVRFLSALTLTDGVIIVSPEYNRTIPAALKNAIEFTRKKEIVGVPMAIAGASSGAFGGVRMFGHLHAVWVGEGGYASPAVLPTPNIGEFAVDNPSEEWKKKADKFLDSALGFFEIIKRGKAV